jgi:hypothetical protein
MWHRAHSRYSHQHAQPSLTKWSRLAEFPTEDELTKLGHDDVILPAVWIRDAAQGLSDCVDAALGLPIDDGPASLRRWS